MTQFLVLYNSEMSAGDQMAGATAEEAKAGMDAWMAWAGEAGDKVIDLGMPVQPKVLVTANSTTESTSKTAGYSILHGETEDDVSALLAKHPHLQVPGNSIEVLEILPMPGM
jgi:hypothetical protein